MHTVIVGAGPAGVALALALARAGHLVTLVERSADLARQFRGERLMPESLDALDRMGALRLLDDVPRQALARTEVYLDGRRSFAVQLAAGGAPQFMSQPVMLRTLIDAAREYPGFAYREGSSVEDLVWKEGRVVGVQLLEGSGTDTLTADLVVAADGRTSVLRRLAGLGDEPANPETFDVLWARLEGQPPSMSAGTSRMYPGRGAMAFALPAPDGGTQLGYVLEKGLYKAIRGEWIDRLIALVDRELAGLLLAQRDRLRPSLLNVVSFVMDRWCQPGFIAVGDAVHPMSPAGGQGIAMALVDALRLSEALVALGDRTDRQAIDSACLEVARARADEVRLVQHAQRKLASVYLQRRVVDRLMVRVAAPILSRIAPGVLTRGIAGPAHLRRAAAPVRTKGAAAPTA